MSLLSLNADARQQIDLEPGDMIVLASDGVLDALSSDRKRFGLEGLERALRAKSVRSSASLIEAIVDDLNGYSKGVHGDRTLLVIHVIE